MSAAVSQIGQTTGAAEAVLGSLDWPNQCCYKASPLSRCYTRRHGTFVRLFRLALFCTKFSCSLFFLPICSHDRATFLRHHFAPLVGFQYSGSPPPFTPFPYNLRSSAKQSCHSIPKPSPRPRRHGFTRAPDMVHLGSLGASIRMSTSVQDYTTTPFWVKWSRQSCSGSVRERGLQEGAVVPLLTPGPQDPKQYLVGCSPEFLEVPLLRGTCRVSVKKGIDHFKLHHPDLRSSDPIGQLCSSYH